MEVSHSVKERTIAENSLVILLQGLRGHRATVDLRDESSATGRVTNVDAFMNVRYVHIPDEVDIRATIEEQLQAIQRVRNFGGRDKGRREFPGPKHK
ncbi:LSM10 protein, partial [Aegotheles bennettii]|nr:LSM10 protein [Aegotheles bennettii]